MHMPHRNTIPKKLLAGLCLLVGVCLPQATVVAGDATPPNILFLFADDQPPGCVGCMGNEHIKTPNLDRLARRGAVFQNAFATTAICCSNRACLLMHPG